ncbi:hypothetical protein CYMTET_4716 [Cymbomonas tetramitiformis]|uniref:RING-CH-type domain-containing protein n=1 Tax=Cymbomonas tetramitiformis TaxID=36881 RepID=A0AAE0H0U4_9CHLO|nr:hypothetical protein CYMTET_4716 [Cymbomonas tetramitiformis]
MNLASKQQDAEDQYVATSEESSSADATPQCRFCLSEDMAEDFVEPCQCSGSARFVHKKCLTRWQRLNRDTECQICRESWRFKLDPLDRLLWLRGSALHTAARAKGGFYISTALRNWLEAGWRSDALILNGVAIWSSDQLLTEMVRGSWGVTAGRWGDVPFSGTADEPDAVWSTIWEQRAPDKFGE